MYSLQIHVLKSQNYRVFFRLRQAFMGVDVKSGQERLFVEATGGLERRKIGRSMGFYSTTVDGRNIQTLSIWYNPPAPCQLNVAGFEYFVHLL